jgi:cytoskeleton protein RodZ
MNEQQELIPMATGEFLKQRRLKRKLSLATVAEVVCLDETLLEDIERDKAVHVALVYRNGYIRTYARYLQVPEDEIQKMLSSTDTDQATIRNIFTESPKRNPMDRWLRATSYVLASLLIGTLAWQFTHEAVRLSQNGSRITSTQKNTVESENAGLPGQAQKIRGTVNASIAPLGALHDSDTGGLDTAEQAWAAISRPIIAEGESRLEISVSADSWIEIVDADGQELEMDLLRGGSDKNYHGKPPFRLLFGRASAVRLLMDGEAVDLTGFTRDDVAQFTWPRQLQADNNEADDN